MQQYHIKLIVFLALMAIACHIIWSMVHQHFVIDELHAFGIADAGSVFFLLFEPNAMEVKRYASRICAGRRCLHMQIEWFVIGPMHFPFGKFTILSPTDGGRLVAVNKESPWGRSVYCACKYVHLYVIVSVLVLYRMTQVAPAAAAASPIIMGYYVFDMHEAVTVCAPFVILQTRFDVAIFGFSFRI